MSAKKIKQLNNRIQKIKEKLADLGPMRPGSISKQYNVCGNPNCRCKDPVKPQKHGPYYQLSYTHKGKSTSEFIKKHRVREVTGQIKNYKEFKKLTAQWVDLSIEKAKLEKKLEAEKK